MTKLKQLSFQAMDEDARQQQIQDAETARWDERAEASAKIRDDWRRRWSLSLTVAHSAGLIGLSSIMLDKGKRPEDWGTLLLPSAWLFLIGLIAAGMIPLVRSYQYWQERELFWVVAREREYGGVSPIYKESDEPEFTNELRKRHWRSRARLSRLASFLEGLSASMFIAALFLPLFHLQLWGMK